MPIAKDTTVTCPRCAARVSVEYRFCPECAFRLGTGAESVDAAPEPVSVWPHVLLVLGALALIGGFVLAGLALFQPAEDPPSIAPPETRPEVRDAVLTVADLPSTLVLHPQGYAESRIGVRVAPGELIDVIVPDIQFARYEVSQGQWREFVDDVAEFGADYAFQFAWKELFRPLEAFEEDLGDPQTLLKDDLPQRVGFAGDAVLSSLEQMRRQLEWATFYVAKSQQYVAYWWQTVAERIEERDGRRLARPEALFPPIRDEHVAWILTPPSWVRIDEEGSLSRELADEDLNLPVTEISLPDAMAFAAWASATLEDSLEPGRRLLVPTRAMFLRAYHDEEPPEDGRGNRWPWGFELEVNLCNSLTLWSRRSPDLTPAPVFVTQEYGNRHTWTGNTARGLVHMAGNVREWVVPGVHRMPDLAESETPYFYVEAKWNWDVAGTMGGSFLYGIEDCDFQSNLTEIPLRRFIDVGFRLAATVTAR